MKGKEQRKMDEPLSGIMGESALAINIWRFVLLSNTVLGLCIAGLYLVRLRPSGFWRKRWAVLALSISFPLLNGGLDLFAFWMMRRFIPEEYLKWSFAFGIMAMLLVSFGGTLVSLRWRHVTRKE
ncbi:MAG: hypothetical protein PHV93_01595 [Candidatus Pacebacteria bacterium]|nr:hypothetical protein [Candidatus Paceibacterota bacterium]